ncbi:hypothetical protein JIN85_07490 [Luteolibacter pohnpeiensis]|uniref:TRAM domain-containing protein n=1 Tax=Luteolibacter pohnpeiensis TaxID=454153 RepID=A0A934S9S2_9BACT|nr:hypothetical protein [Luteolibacter pohnpeiensis]MBK1882252.1 hypothetical protein [Luteolibacter pohnpeiensis]
MAAPPSVNIVRLIYLLVCEAAGVAIAQGVDASITVGLLAGLVVAGVFIWVETLTRGFTLRGFSTGTFGLGVGLFCAWLLTRVQIFAVLELMFQEKYSDQEIVKAVNPVMDAFLYSTLGFFGAALSLRSNRDDFAFIIPYVRFRQDSTTGQPLVLDAEAIMDGRVLSIFRAGFLHGRLIVPKFVLEDLQMMANSMSNGERLRGQRGLDFLDQMQRAADVQVSIDDSVIASESKSNHTALIEIARLLSARLMTVDENLTKVAKLQEIEVLNITELDDALKPSATVGDKVRITLVRNGKESHQAVGYLSNGTMIVVNHSVEKIGSTVEATVVSTLQTSAGTMVFAELIPSD